MLSVNLYSYKTDKDREEKNVNNSYFLGSFSVENESKYLAMIKFIFDNELLCEINENLYFIDDYFIHMPTDPDFKSLIKIFLLEY